MGNANKEESNKLTIKGVVTNDEPGVIYLPGGNCNMYDGVKICDNTSNNYYGSGGTISNNNATDGVGGGIYYDSNSKIYLSGTISVQDNTAYCQSSDIKCTNNLNIISSSDNTTVYPIYIEGSIKGSKIGITDPKLWKDALDDSDNGASSLEYLTSGYNANNPKYPDNNPSQYFTSDHAGVFCGRFRRGCQFSRILL